MNRRSFVKRATAAAGALSLTGLPVVSPSKRLRGSSPLGGKISVQLYTLRSLMKGDVPGTLKKVADAGYEYVEFAGYFDHEPADVRKMLDDLGLKASSGHFGMDLLWEDPDAVIEGASAIGMEYVIAPSMGGGDRSSIDAYKKAAAYCNDVGEKCKAAGLQFGYHNHSFEFEEIDGEIPYHILLDETDADLVKMELDLCWIVNAGKDPHEYFARNPGRFPLFHVKDLSDGKPDDLGKGTIDFAKIFSKSKQAGVKYYVVEHDHPRDPVESITSAMAYLQALDGDGY